MDVILRDSAFPANTRVNSSHSSFCHTQRTRESCSVGNTDEEPSFPHELLSGREVSAPSPSTSTRLQSLDYSTD